MTRAIQDTTRVARKEHTCNACELWIGSGYGKEDVTPDQWATVQAAKRDSWKIQPGQKYRRSTYSDDGHVGVFRARPDMDALCFELDMYDE